MAAYIIRRIIQGILTFLGVSVLVFTLGRLTGDPVRLLVPETATVEQREEVRRQLGLDRPILIQYGDFLYKLAQGDLGRSYLHREEVSKLVLSRMPATMELALLSMLISIVVSIPLGVFVALKRNSGWDLLGSTIALLGQATPNFWLGMMLIIVFGVELKLLPISGRGTPAHIVLPAMTLALQSLGYFTRLMRSSMLDVLGQDYMRTARSKGATEYAILAQHGLKNALIPVITMIGMQFGNVLTGAFIVETVFAWPGIGRLGVNSLFERDFPVIQGVVLLSSGVFVLANLIVDILYSVLDPRIRLE
jgi:ABC-type dipeptide/oligopeptide/nickel transport system permease component